MSWQKNRSYQTYYVREAVLSHLAEREDIYISLGRLEKPTKQWLQEDLEKEVDLDNYKWDDRARKELRKLDRPLQKEILIYLRTRIATQADPRRFGKPLSYDKWGF